jgi:hypothetical protein
MVKVTEIKQTCTACPSQWEGKTDDGQFIYVRSRHDYLEISLGSTIDDAIWGDKRTVVVSMDDNAAGWLEYDELKKLTADKIDWPEVCP